MTRHYLAGEVVGDPDARPPVHFRLGWVKDNGGELGLLTDGEYGLLPVQTPIPCAVLGEYRPVDGSKVLVLEAGGDRVIAGPVHPPGSVSAGPMLDNLWEPASWGGVDFGTGPWEGHWCMVGRLVWFVGSQTFNSTSGWTGNLSLTLPSYMPDPIQDTVVNAIVNDALPHRYLCEGRLATTRQLTPYSPIGAAGARITATAPMTWANGDTFEVTGTYMY